MEREESLVRDQILAAAFAPRVYFHSEEIYFPLAAEDYIRACDLFSGEELLGPAEKFAADWLHQDPNCYLKIRNFDVVYGWPHRLPPPVYANVLSVGSGSGYGYGSSSGSIASSSDSSFSLLKPEAKKTQLLSSDSSFSWADEPSRKTQLRSGNSTFAEIQYFFCYAYNGSLFPAAPTLGAHEGDWEHVTVVVDREAFWRGVSPRECLQGVYYAAHGGESGWVRDPPLTQHERIIVYASRYNHACYPRSGRQVRRGFGLIDDFTDSSGLRWDTWENVTLLTADLPWSRFAGRWGRPARRYLGENPAPLGPHFKSYYHSGQLPRLDEAEDRGASEKGVEMIPFPRSMKNSLQVY